MLSIFTAPLELRSVVRGRELVFLSSTTKRIQECEEKLYLLLEEIREWPAESIPWVGSAEAPTSRKSYGTFE